LEALEDVEGALTHYECLGAEGAAEGWLVILDGENVGRQGTSVAKTGG